MKTTEILSQDSRYYGQDSNRVHPKYNPEALAPESTSSMFSYFCFYYSHSLTSIYIYIYKCLYVDVMRL
jgi:hypothetical protein